MSGTVRKLLSLFEGSNSHSAATTRTNAANVFVTSNGGGDAQPALPALPTQPEGSPSQPGFFSRFSKQRSTSLSPPPGASTETATQAQAQPLQQPQQPDAATTPSGAVADQGESSASPAGPAPPSPTTKEPAPVNSPPHASSTSSSSSSSSSTASAAPAPALSSPPTPPPPAIVIDTNQLEPTQPNNEHGQRGSQPTTPSALASSSPTTPNQQRKSPGQLPGKGINFLNLIVSKPEEIIVGPPELNGGSSRTSLESVHSSSSFLDVLEKGGQEREVLAKRLSKRLSFMDHRRKSSMAFDTSIFTPEILMRYRVVEKLGVGGFADVYKIQDRIDHSCWALKVIFKNRVKNQGRLDQEIEALQRAQHKNIVCLRETIVSEKHLYLRQDLAEGGCLFDLLLDMGGFGEAKTAIVMKGIFEAVAYLHSIGIVHRDIKLENVLLGKPNDLTSVKLCDFGVARIMKEGEGESSNVRKRFRPVILSHVGSVAYMAPEVFLAKPYDEGVDLWACGVMLFMLLSLSAPFGNDEEDPGAEQDQIARITKADFNFSDPAWIRRSDASKDLCSALLKFDPNERLSASQAIVHPWILEFTGELTTIVAQPVTSPLPALAEEAEEVGAA